MTSTNFIKRLIPISCGAALAGGLLFAQPRESDRAELGAFKFAQMCDTQLGMGGYEHDVRTFELAVDKLNAMQPDFVVICGDLVNKADDKSFADFNRIKAGFKIPCYCAAGNHDVENKPTAESLARYREKVGKDYYAVEHKGYTFVIANTQLWKAPLAGESEKHDAWFSATLAAAKAKASPVVVVVHYPLFLEKPDEKEVYFNLPVAKRKELLALFEANGVVAVLAGHTHKLLVNEYKGIQLVNGETTSKNFDKRPMGFRMWSVDSGGGMSHEFVALEEAAPVKQAAYPKVKHMIDTHIHLYDTTREKGVPWPPPGDKVLYKPHLPAEFKKVSKPTGLTGVIVVEASDRLEDNNWVLDLVDDDDYFVGLVGNIDPYREDFEKQLRRLKKDPRFVGVRARNGRDAKPIDFTDAKVLESFRTLAKHGLSVDILQNGGGIEAVEKADRLAREVPELRLVVDHVLGYDFDGKAPDPKWVAAVEKLGENKNVWCKVSGLYQRSIPQPAPQSLDHYGSVLDVLWKNFGEKRLVFGSNWPCTKNTGDYASYVRLVNAYFAGKGQEACERYFWKNAAEAYRLKLK